MPSVNILDHGGDTESPDNGPALLAALAAAEGGQVTVPAGVFVVDVAAIGAYLFYNFDTYGGVNLHVLGELHFAGVPAASRNIFLGESDGVNIFTGPGTIRGPGIQPHSVKLVYYSGATKEGGAVQIGDGLSILEFSQIVDGAENYVIDIGEDCEVQSYNRPFRIGATDDDDEPNFLRVGAGTRIGGMHNEAPYNVRDTLLPMATNIDLELMGTAARPIVLWGKGAFGLSDHYGGSTRKPTKRLVDHVHVEGGELETAFVVGSCGMRIRDSVTHCKRLAQINSGPTTFERPNHTPNELVSNAIDVNAAASLEIFGGAVRSNGLIAVRSFGGSVHLRDTKLLTTGATGLFCPGTNFAGDEDTEVTVTIERSYLQGSTDAAWLKGATTLYARHVQADRRIKIEAAGILADVRDCEAIVWDLKAQTVRGGNTEGGVYLGAGNNAGWYGVLPYPSAALTVDPSPRTLAESA